MIISAGGVGTPYELTLRILQPALHHELPTLIVYTTAVKLSIE